MTQVQITSWRAIPSLVVARDGETVTKTPLPARFQEAIDEAAMRVGAVDADAYLDGWVRSDWAQVPESPVDACERVVAELEQVWSESAVQHYVDSLQA